MPICRSVITVPQGAVKPPISDLQFLEEGIERHSTSTFFFEKPIMATPRGQTVWFGNEFPNDDLKDLFRRLHQHSKDRRFRLLSVFLEESTAILKEEVANLPQQLQELVPHFDTACTLPEVDFRQGPLGAAMESALLTILELGMLIGYLFSPSGSWTAWP